MSKDYFEFALSSDCLPLETFEFMEFGCDRDILDKRCSVHNEFMSVLPSVCTPEVIVLLDKLESRIKEFNITYAVLSLSGGVDSMTHLILLCMLRVKLGIEFAACHIRHSSRPDEALKEETWVRHMCKTLGVRLFSHHVVVARPHGSDKSLVSRDDFEELTRKVRFSMYYKTFRICFPAVTESPLVIVAHHMDDVDENRLAELGKGTIFDIDSMPVMDLMDDVRILRPLCQDTRKDEIIKVAQQLAIPYMKNSTPEWSRRGWIRSVIDGLDNARKDELLEILTEAGRLSSHAYSRLCDVTSTWKNKGISSVSLVLEKKKETCCLETRMTCLDLQSLFSELTGIEADLTNFLEICSRIAKIWNASVEENKNDKPGVSCPIQLVVVYGTSESVRPLILLQAFLLCFDLLGAIFRNQLPSRASVRSLVESINSAKGKKIGIVANLHKTCPVVYLTLNDCICVLEKHDEAMKLFGGKGEALVRAVSLGFSKL